MQLVFTPCRRDVKSGCAGGIAFFAQCTRQAVEIVFPVTLTWPITSLRFIEMSSVDAWVERDTSARDTQEYIISTFFMLLP